MCVIPDISSALASRSRVATLRNMIHAENAIAILRSDGARPSIVAADFVTSPLQSIGLYRDISLRPCVPPSRSRICHGRARMSLPRIRRRGYHRLQKDRECIFVVDRRSVPKCLRSRSEEGRRCVERTPESSSSFSAIYAFSAAKRRRPRDKRRRGESRTSWLGE